MLNKLEEMRVSYFYLYPLRDLQWKKPSWGLSYAHRLMNLLENLCKYKGTMSELWMNYESIMNQLQVD
jgi:hypothetical protein